MITWISQFFIGQKQHEPCPLSVTKNKDFKNTL